MSTLKQRGGRICFTLDVLTDGSEYTGHGTLFLSVWKKPQATSTGHDWLVESMEWNPPLARYAIAGIGDATARLCADQRFKLASTKAVFLPSLECGDGLSALLMALRSAGAPSLHIGCSNGNTMDDLAEVVLGARRQLQITICQLPTTAIASQNNKEDDTISWWRLYSDEYLTVHGCCPRTNDSSNPLIYLYTMHDGSQTTNLLLIPPHETPMPPLSSRQLPLDDNCTPMAINYILALDTNDKQVWKNILKNDDDSIHFLFTQPSSQCLLDSGILMRSQKISKYLQDELPHLFAVPDESNDNYNNKVKETTSIAKVQENTSSSSSSRQYQRLKSGTSLVLEFSKTNDDPLSVLDRCAERIKDEQYPSSSSSFSMSDEWMSTIESLRTFDEPTTTTTTTTTTNSIHNEKNFVSVHDENEIDLDEEEDNDDNNNDDVDQESMPADSGTNKIPPINSNTPKLLVLGTGCATPSAVRGAAGYALSFPSEKGLEDIYLLDCGEGVATMLSRFGKRLHSEWLGCIRGIWISHAHLDHYGGLPTILRLLHQWKTVQACNNTKHDSNEPLSKRHKWNPPTPCWVMAPPKVLKYLDIMLNCQYGVQRSDGIQLFLPRKQHSQAPSSYLPTPWMHFQHISVQHNCSPSFGLLIGWKRGGGRGSTNTTMQCHSTLTTTMSQNESLSWFCYSGDTRPCDKLIRACQRVMSSSSSPSSPSLFLLHEATFENNDQEQAKQKQHSTVAEAVQVAVDCGATKVLLTHFSQRYVSVTSLSSTQVNNSPTTNALRHNVVPVGLAMDGLCVSLE